MKRKIHFLLILPIIVLMLSGCHIAYIPGVADIPAHVEHEIYNNEEICEAKIVSIDNYAGNITVKKSDSEKIKVIVKLVQSKKVGDLDKNKENLVIKPTLDGEIMMINPLSPDGTSYWEWLWGSKNGNYSDIQVDFEVHVPDTVQEIRVKTKVGNIAINDVTARIYAQTNVGNVKGENITPLDNSVFVSDVIQNALNPAVSLEISDLSYANRIEANASVGNVSVTVPAGSEYEVDDAGNLEEYDFEEGDIDELLEDLGVDDVDKLLEKYDSETDAFDKLPKKSEPINAKEGKTVLATKEIPYVSHVVIREK